MPIPPDWSETKRYNYPLNSDSIIFDVGGYRGDFASEWVSKVDPTIYIFEPFVDLHTSHLHSRFKNNDKVQYFRYGLSDFNGNPPLAQAGKEAGSLSEEMFQKWYHGLKEHGTEVEIRKFSEVYSELGSPKVDLIKINIEGEEYPLLNHILDEGLINNFKYIQIQYHDFIKDAGEKRAKIVERMRETHNCQWEFPWIWESWERKDA